MGAPLKKRREVSSGPPIPTSVDSVMVVDRPETKDLEGTYKAVDKDSPEAKRQEKLDSQEDLEE